MKIKKLNEIVNGNDDLIGADDIPTNGSDLESQANHPTDYNVKTGQQPFRYDMLGRFGFTLLPFMEGEDKNQGQAELENVLVDLMNERYLDSNIIREIPRELRLIIVNTLLMVKPVRKL